MSKCDNCGKRIRGVPWARIRRGMQAAGVLCTPCHDKVVAALKVHDVPISRVLAVLAVHDAS